MNKGGRDLLRTQVLLSGNLQILFPPVLELQEGHSLVQHHERVCSGHLQLASGNAAVDRLLVDDVLHNGVRQAVHKANVVGAAQLLGLRLTRAQRPNRRIDREMLRLRLYSGQTVPNLFHGNLHVATDLFDALLVQSQLERGGSTLVLLHEAHPEERCVPARKRGRRLKPTGQIIQHFL